MVCNSSCLRDSLQLQHSTNLNIQRSQSTHRFNALQGSFDSNRGGELSQSTNCDEGFEDYRSSANSNGQANATVNTSTIAQTAQDNNTDPNYLEDVDSNIDFSIQLNESEPEEDSNTIANNRAKLGLPLQASCSTAPEHQPPPLQSTTGTSTAASRRATIVEFADDHMRSSRTNSVSSSSMLSVVENKDCDYLKLVMGFKRTLMLPEVFFAGDSFGCFCEGCAPSLQSSMVKGWVRFKLNQTLSSACAVNTADDSVWTTAYYNARVEKIRSVLDHGQPLPIGKLLLFFVFSVY